METKQSSLDFYREHLMALVSTGKTKFKSENEIFEQAKEMHKHQIMAAYDMGNQNQYDKINIKDYLNVDEEQYYNETFGK